MGCYSGLKVYTGCGMLKITIRITGLSEGFGRDDGMKEPYQGGPLRRIFI